MGQYDAFKATASASFVKPVEFKFKTVDYSVSGMTLNRLPGESESAYMLRLTAVNERQKQARQQQFQYQQEQQKRRESYEQECAENNAKYLYKRLNSISYNSNNKRSLELALSEFNQVKINNLFTDTRGLFSVNDVNENMYRANLFLENLKKGEKNSEYLGDSSGNKQNNYAGFDFQGAGNTNMIS